MKQAVGAVLLLGSLYYGWEAYQEWQSADDWGVLGGIAEVFGGPSKEDAVVQGLICVVALVIGATFLGAED